MVLFSHSLRSEGAVVLLASALLMVGCSSKKEEATVVRLENADALVEQADSAASRCQIAKVNDTSGDGIGNTAAGAKRAEQETCEKSAALNQQASAAVNTAGVP